MPRSYIYCTMIAAIYYIIIQISKSRLICFPIGEFGNNNSSIDFPCRIIRWIINNISVARWHREKCKRFYLLFYLSLNSVLFFIFLLRFFFPSRSSLLSFHGCVCTRKCVRRSRETSWLLIHVAADYFLASLWHQIPYSNQNGESASSRAQWSTQANDSHVGFYTDCLADIVAWEIFLSGFFNEYGCAFTLVKLWRNFANNFHLVKILRSKIKTFFYIYQWWSLSIKCF